MAGEEVEIEVICAELMSGVTMPKPRHIHGDNLPDPTTLPLGASAVCSCGKRIGVGMSEGPWPGHIWKRRWLPRWLKGVDR